MLKGLARFHDAITSVSFAAAAGCVAIITGSFVYEVIARYFFGAPTSWAYDLSSYALCPMIFLAIPAMTQQRAHIAMSHLLEGLSQALRQRIALVVVIIAGFTCLVAAWITGAETWRQYVTGTQTISANPIPKWWISIFIPYGLLSSGIHFLRLSLSGANLSVPVVAEGIP